MKHALIIALTIILNWQVHRTLIQKYIFATARAGKSIIITAIAGAYPTAGTASSK